MTIWTEADRLAVKQAYMDLVAGKRKVRVQFSSGAGNRAAEYQAVDMGKLRALLEEINSALDAGSRVKTFTLRTQKGL